KFNGRPHDAGASRGRSEGGGPRAEEKAGVGSRWRGGRGQDVRMSDRAWGQPFRPTAKRFSSTRSERHVRQRAGVFCAMKQGPIRGVNIGHNTASRGYQGGELDDDSTPVSQPLKISHNTLPQVLARMGLLPQDAVTPPDGMKTWDSSGGGDPQGRP